MKNLIIITLFVFLGTLSSCISVSKVHQDIMGKFQTKQQVINRFGLPTEKRTGEGIEEWVYNYGTISRATNFGNSNTNASAYGGYNSAYGNANANMMNVAQFTQVNKYVKFTFDLIGNVLKWESQGVILRE